MSTQNVNAATDPRVRRHPLGYYEIVDKPDAAALKRYYAERYFESGLGNYRPEYSEAERRFFRAKLEQRAAAVRAVGLATAGRMLDVGCGEGFALAYFAELGWQVEGIDYSAASVEAMNPACAGAVEAGDVMTLLDRRIDTGATYDLVWLGNVLEHVPDPPGLLKRLRRLVSPGGCLVVTVPNDFSALQAALLARGDIDQAFWVAPPDHLAYFDRDSLSRTAEATGWTCALTLADFPIDWLLLHPGSNYIKDRSLGPAAHAARIAFENLIATQPVDRINAFYAAMAELGLGRQITAFLRPEAPA